MSDTEDNVQKPPHIRYGSIISISHFQDDNAFIYADGHVKKDITLKSFSLYKKAQQLKQLEMLRKKKQKLNKYDEEANRLLTKQIETKQYLLQDIDDNASQELGQDFEDETSQKKDQDQGKTNQYSLQNTLNKLDMEEENDAGSRMNQYNGVKQMLGERDIDQKLKESTRQKLNQNKKKKLSNLNKQSFSNCLFMVFPSLTNTQKNRVVKSLGYESEESDNELDDAETIFINPYVQQQQQARGNNKASVETQLLLKKIQTLNQPQSPKDKKGKQDEIKSDPANADNDEEEDKKQDQDYLDRENLDKQKVNLLNEYKANFDTFKKAKDQTVSFNSVVQLLHLNSAKWLAIKPIEAKHQKENFRMTLEAYTSENTMFKIIPSFKYQKDGDQVIFANEIVYIARAQDINNRTTYFNASDEITKMNQNLNTAYTQQNLNTYQPRKSILNKSLQHLPNYINGINQVTQQSQFQIAPIENEIQKREINGSQENQTNFKLNLFQESYTEFQQYLKCGDVIWLHHSEATSQIGVSRKDKGVNKYTFTSMNLKTWMSLENLELKVIGIAKQSIYEQYSGNTFGMWQVESQKISDGGFVEFGNLYRLKHLSSGFFLSVLKKKNIEISQSNNINDFFELGLVEVPDSSSLFTFDCLHKDKQKSKYVQLNSYVYIMSKKYKYYIDVEVDETQIQKSGNSYFNYSFPQLKINQNEQLLFKVYQADKNEVWEINYVISCFGYLTKLALAFENNPIRTKSDEKIMFSHVRKIKKAIQCIVDLTRFCENKVYNISPQQKFGTANQFRQKLLREQYFIDLLIKILENALQKFELDIWIKSQDILQSSLVSHTKNKSSISQFNVTQKNSTQEFQMKGGDSQIDQKEYVAYINWKVTLSKFIYKLLEAICMQNSSNQIYTFQLIPFFQIHGKYISEAVDCISNICSSNEQLLINLSENLQIQYDYNENTYIQEDQSRTVKFLINLYDGNPKVYKESSVENKVQFAQHEKLANKPINLINFFMSLLWDSTAKNKSDYLRFLSRVCYFNEKGITINQENIYKLYKKFSAIREEIKLNLQYENGKIKRIQNFQELENTCEQIMFYANLSFGRNYLWSKYLKDKFKSEDLFSLIWDPKIINDDHQQKLSSSLCRLAQTLYIDYEPLNRVYKPNYCRLFQEVDIKKKKEKKDKNEKDKQSEILSSQDVEKYRKLLSNLKEYLNQMYIEIDEQARLFNPDKSRSYNNLNASGKSPNSNPFKQSFDQSIIPQKPKNISGTEVLQTIMDLLDLLLHLNIYSIVDKEVDFSEILSFLLRILQYDRIGIKFMSAFYLTEMNSSKKKLEQQNAAALSNIAGGFCDGLTKLFKLLSDLIQPQSKSSNQDDQDGNIFEFRTVDDNMLFNNPIMKGFVKLNNLIETIMYADSESIQLENKIKQKICEILDKFLSFRQDYLLTNSLCFFKKIVKNDIEKIEKNDSKLFKAFDIHKQNQNIGKQTLSGFFASEFMNIGGGDDDTPLEDKLLVNRSRVDSNTPLNQKRINNPTPDLKQQKQSSFKPKLALNNSKDLGSNPQLKSQDSKKVSIFGGKPKQNAIIKPIDEQFSDWWIDTLKKEQNKYILPPISMTGLQKVDKQYQEPEEKLNLNLNLNINLNLMGTEEVVQPRFKNFVDDKKQIIYSFDQLLTMKEKGKKKLKDIGQLTHSALPSLLCTFLQTQDQDLEIKVLNIIMRLFNQRFELVENLGELQIIFDANKTQLFQFLRQQFRTVSNLMEQSEIWFQTLEKKQNVQLINAQSGEPTPSNLNISSKLVNKIMDQNDNSPFQLSKGISVFKKSTFSEKEHEAYMILKLIENIRNGLCLDIIINPNQDQLGQNVLVRNKNIDPEKQKIHKYLKLYEPIIQLIKDGMPHFDSIIMSESYTILTKRMIYKLFLESFGYLKDFVTKNPENQMLISMYLNSFLSHLQYDLGQIDLICEIYKDNIDLIGNINNDLVQTFINLIEHEGRQDKFLDFFIVIQKSNKKMVFENQLLVLNSFLPLEGLNELEIKLTYSDGAKKTSDIQFYFEDVNTMEDQNLIDRLMEVDFRDTYLDQPFRYHAKLLNCLLYSTLQTNVDINDPFLNISKDHFNISVAKLKKTFSFFYLLEVLQKEDDFVQYSGYSYKEDEENNDQGNENLQSQFQFDKELRKQGFSYLKPHVCDFIKIVHIFSDTQMTETLFSELTYTQKEFSQFVEKEGLRFISVQEDKINLRYVEYVCIHVFGMVQAYFDKYLQNYVDKHSKEEEERRDLVKVREFVENIAKKMKSSRTIKKQFQNYDKHYERVKTLQRSFFKATNVILNNDEADDYFDAMSQSDSRSDAENEQVDDLEHDQQTKQVGGGISLFPSSNFKQDFKSSNQIVKKEVKLDSSSRKESLFGSKDKIGIQEMILQEYQDLHWKQFVVAMNKSDLIIEQVDREVKAFADAILNIEQYIDSEYQRYIDPKLDLNLILKKFIKFLQFSLKVGNSKQTALTLINVLKTIVEKDPEQIVNRQDQMDKLGASQMVLIILSEYSHNLDGQLYIDFVSFLNTLLKGGNSRVQKTVYDFFVNQPKSEIIFMKFSQFIRKQIDYIEQEAKIKKRKEEEKKGKLKNIGNDDFQEGISQIVDDEEGKDDGEEGTSFTHAQDIIILDCVLDFLSLAVAGHYTEMQDYIREQFNLRNKYDMVQNVADLLKAYYNEGGQQQYYDGMMKCLDTLIKFVQGPCLNNQQAVSDSKFFDVAHDLFEREMKYKSGPDDGKSQFTSRKSQTGSKQGRQTIKTKSILSRIKPGSGEEPLENWMIARLQYKCLCLVHSLLEGRNVKIDQSIIKKIARNIQIDTIEKRIVEIYTNFDTIYNGDYIMASFEHINFSFDPNNVKEQENPYYKQNMDKYPNTIIQNAFMLYILFCLYKDSGERIDNNIMQFYKLQYKKSILTEKNALVSFLTGDNLIGNIVTFVKSFIESSIKTAQSIKNQAQKQIKTLREQPSEEEDELARRKLQAKQQEKFKENLQKAVKFLFKNTAHIEVLRNGQIEIIYFQLLPFCQRLPKDKKKEFNEQVDRSNEKAKVTGLMTQADYLLDVCRQEENLNKFFMSNKFISLFANYVKLWKDVAFMLTIVLNIFNLLTFTSKFGDRFYNQHLFLDYQSYSVQQTNRIIYLLGAIMTCCSMFVVSFFLVKNLPVLIKRIWSADKGQENELFKHFLARIFLWLFKLIKIIFSLLKELEIIYYICYGTFAILGTVVHPFFFTFHLSEIFIRFPLLMSVINAVYIPRKNLFLTYILYLILAWLFSLFAYYFYASTILTDECSTLAYCFGLLLDQTFKSNGGIGGYITGNNQGTDHDGNRTDTDFFKPGRFFFDNLFQIFVVIIMVNIVAGQIIDQFGELRETENSKIEDTQGKCFICGIKSDLFDKKVDKSSRGGFYSHIKENHHMWNYVFYIGYLRSINPLEYSGIQQFIYDMIQENEPAWFPTNRASDLDLEEDNSEKEKQMVNQILENTNQINESAKNVLRTLSQLKKN
ncbi:hypothetical protein ABPG74_009439 [Tetrahymena malaccensis]